MEFRFSGGEPVYQQIVEQFRDAVLAGQFAPGERVPPVRELAAQARVNPNTMQRAMLLLEQESLLVGEGTAGRHVTRDEAVLAALRADAVSRLVTEFKTKLEVLGVSSKEAAELLLKEE